MKVAWVSFFPVEWLPDAPEGLRRIPRRHPASWQRVLVDEFKSATGLELHIFAVRSQFPFTQSFTRNNATFHCIKVPRGTRELTLFWWETIVLRRALRRIQPDVIHAWGSERGAALVASRLRYPYLVSVQGLLQWYATQVDLDFYGRIDARLERVSLPRAKIITTESRFGVEWLTQRYGKAEIRQVEHAPNWLFHKLERRPQLNPVKFLYVGVMGRVKGTDLLLTALDRLCSEFEFTLTIIGGSAPSFLQEMRSLTSHVLWKRIQMREGLSQPEVGDEVAQATMMLFPTRADTSPNSVKEAVVAGLPVLASAVGGIPDYVVPDQNGFLFSPNDMEQFICTVRLAMNHHLFKLGNVDPLTLQKMRAYLSPKVMAEKFLQGYRRVMSSG